MSERIQRLRLAGLQVTGKDHAEMPAIDRLVRWSQTTLPVSADRIQGWLVESAHGLLRLLVGLSGAAFAGALGAAIGFLLTLFLLFFFLRDGDEMAERLLRFAPMSEARKVHLVDHLVSVTRAVVLGVLLTAAVQGTLVGIGFAIIGLPSPVVFGVLAALAALIPIVGAALVWVPAFAVLGTQGRWGAATFLACVDLLTPPTGAYQSKTLDHVEDRQGRRVVVYHVVFENDPDVTLEVNFRSDDPDHRIIDIEWQV